mmetsp:Transcript_142773/g.248959  ORF Transcript_142773/g.248959 Transcript_142773/m.248959 type:complete len:205 (+) Transcript_142773:33-647(+)
MMFSFLANTVALFAAVLVNVECRFLAPTAAPAVAPEAAAGLSVDDQIQALQAQIAGKENEIEDAGGVVDQDFEHHCKPDVRAALEAAPDLPVAEKKYDGPFAASFEASDRKQLVENEEFLLGLLIMHQTRHNWSYEQELDAICDLAHGNPLITKLYKHHSRAEPLSAQLAKMMDEERRHMKPTTAPAMKLEGDSVGTILKKLTR